MLRLWAFAAGGIKILHAVWQSQEIRGIKRIYKLPELKSEFSKTQKWGLEVQSFYMEATEWPKGSQASSGVWRARQEYWSGLSCPPSRESSNPGIEPRSSTLQYDSSLSEPQESPKYTATLIAMNLPWRSLFVYFLNPPLLPSRHTLFYNEQMLLYYWPLLQAFPHLLKADYHLLTFLSFQPFPIKVFFKK